jgi:hypothetical protein
MPEARRLTRRPRPAEAYEEEEARPRHLHRGPSDRREPPTQLRRQPEEEAEGDDGIVAVASGWSGYKRTKANAPTRWTSLYKVPDEEQLIMFLEDGPYASFLMHWCDWVPRGQKQSYVCLQEDCPLDEIQAPQARVRFNILDCAGDTPLLTTFECGITVAETLDKFAKNTPLEGGYFAVCMTGSKKQRRTQIRPVKVRDLEEDWKFKALSEAEIAKFEPKLWDASAVERNTRAELQEVADSYTD